MAETVASALLKALQSLLQKDLLLKKIVKEVNELETQLKETKYLLEHADRRQHEKKIVRNKITKLRDLTYDAEDAIAVFVAEKYYHMLKRLKGFVSVQSLKSKIVAIKTSMAKIGEDIKSMLNIDGGESSAAATGWARRTFPDILVDECFVGKEDELRTLVDRLVGINNYLVVSLWGMGGIGKTTIAKYAYNQRNVTSFFESFAWVCVTQHCDVRSVLEDVLKQLAPENVGGVSNLGTMQLNQQLSQIQSDKRCLIVLDDIWETGHWVGLKHAFVSRASQSKILITTRAQDLVELGNNYAFQMEVELLKADDAWELLKKKAFPLDPNSDFARDESTIELGKKMVKKCGYLPLAICLLGGVLSGRNTTRAWELANDDVDAYLNNIQNGDGNENESKLEAVVRLSYDDLPYHLKPCFLYLGVLRDGESMAAADLYRMWISQGMISQESSDKSPMELAEDYLSQLVSKSIVQAKRKDMTHKTKYSYCSLHCVVRKVCSSIGEKEKYKVQTLEYTGGKFCDFLDDALSRAITRHLVIHFKTELQMDDGKFKDHQGENDNRKYLRSLHLHNDIKGGERIELPTTVDFRRFKSLRSLAFEGFTFARRKLPKGVTSLVHLRNLRFRNCELDELQSSIKHLVYLEILDFLLSKNTKIPEVVKEMDRLRQLALPRYDMEKIGKYQLKLDEGLNHLEALQGLNSVVHKDSCYTRMKKLQRFSAYIFDKKSYEAIMMAIGSNWEKLVYTFIVVEEGWEFTSEEVNKAFKCKNLTDLVIRARLGRLLTECKSNIICSNIASLCLSKCNIEEDPMEVLGNLASLKRLCFHLGSFLGERMTCPASSFPCLKSFELDELQNLKELIVEQHAMPLLSRLHIRRCVEMEMVPEGLSAISSLEDLIIEGTPELARRVKAINGDGEEGEDFHKVRHVKITFK